MKKNMLLVLSLIVTGSLSASEQDTTECKYIHEVEGYQISNEVLIPKRDLGRGASYQPETTNSFNPAGLAAIITNDEVRSRELAGMSGVVNTRVVVTRIEDVQAFVRIRTNQINPTGSSAIRIHEEVRRFRSARLAEMARNAEVRRLRLAGTPGVVNTRVVVTRTENLQICVDSTDPK